MEILSQSVMGTQGVDCHWTAQQEPQNQVEGPAANTGLISMQLLGDFNAIPGPTANSAAGMSFCCPASRHIAKEQEWV